MLSEDEAPPPPLGNPHPTPWQKTQDRISKNRHTLLTISKIYNIESCTRAYGSPI